MRQRVRLDTLSDIHNFIAAVSKVEGKVYLEDNTGCRVSAQSLLGALLSMEWEETYISSEKDISMEIFPWII